jgi:hypothetical protein
MEEIKESKRIRVLVPMTKEFRKEVKKRALLSNLSMQDWIERACVEKMLREDSYN